jgi:hypothetical protein
MASRSDSANAVPKHPANQKKKQVYRRAVGLMVTPPPASLPAARFAVVSQWRLEGISAVDENKLACYFPLFINMLLRITYFMLNHGI